MIRVSQLKLPVEHNEEQFCQKIEKSFQHICHIGILQKAFCGLDVWCIINKKEYSVSSKRGNCFQNRKGAGQDDKN